MTEEVLVLEHIAGSSGSADDHGLDDERAAHLAREFFRAYVRQVAAEGVYHADPHRGNVLLTPDGRLALLDFGLLGRLDDDTRTTIAQLLLAIAQNRGDDVAALIVSLSHTTLESDEPAFVAELRRKLPRYHWRPLSGIRAGEAPRRSPADVRQACDPAPDQLRARGQDAGAGGLDCANARPDEWTRSSCCARTRWS